LDRRKCLMATAARSWTSRVISRQRLSPTRLSRTVCCGCKAQGRSVAALDSACVDVLATTLPRHANAHHFLCTPISLLPAFLIPSLVARRCGRWHGRGSSTTFFSRLFWLEAVSAPVESSLDGPWHVRTCQSVRLYAERLFPWHVVTRCHSAAVSSE